MRIIGPPSARYEDVASNGQSLTQYRFRSEMMPPLWREALRYNIDPVGVVAQSIKETGGGAFGGQVKFEFCNPCGLKIRSQNLFPGVTDGDNPLAHAMFPSWDVGARAHVQHLRAYAGWAIPGDDLNVDPRYIYVIGKAPLENWSELGGRWAPSPTYGQEIEALMTRLRGG